jgi:hypothetical protein
MLVVCEYGQWTIIYSYIMHYVYAKTLNFREGKGTTQGNTLLPRDSGEMSFVSADRRRINY